MFPPVQVPRTRLCLLARFGLCVFRCSSFLLSHGGEFLGMNDERGWVGARWVGNELLRIYLLVVLRACCCMVGFGVFFCVRALCWLILRVLRTDGLIIRRLKYQQAGGMLSRAAVHTTVIRCGVGRQ